jgi:uncharacterized membrane protein
MSKPIIVFRRPAQYKSRQQYRDEGSALTYLINNSHFIVNHIPIAMLFFSFIFDLCAVIIKKKDWHTAGFLSLIVGTLGAIAAVITGPDAPQDTRNPLFHDHQLYANLTMYLFIVLSLARLFFHYRKKIDIGKTPIYLFIALIGAGLVTYTGHLGGKMVHKDGNFSGGPGGQGFGQGQGRPGGQSGQGGQGGANVQNGSGNNTNNNNNSSSPTPAK